MGRSRTTDLDRWHQLSSKESLFVHSDTNYKCPFRFINREPHSPPSSDKSVEENINIKSPTVLMSLADFSENCVKKNTDNQFEEWEKTVRKRISGRRSNGKGDDNNTPKLRKQKSKLFQAAQLRTSDVDNRISDLQYHKNPIYTLFNEDERSKHKLEKILEFRSLKLQSQFLPAPKEESKFSRSKIATSTPDPVVFTLDLSQNNNTEPENVQSKKGIRALRRSLVKNHLLPSPRGTKKEKEKEHPPIYRTSEKKKKRSSLELKVSCEKLLAAAALDESVANC